MSLLAKQTVISPTSTPVAKSLALTSRRSSLHGCHQIWNCKTYAHHPHATISQLCISEIDACNQDWTFPPDSFYYVHFRYLVGCIPDWNKLFEEAYKTLKPGGWIESFEASPTIESDDESVKPDSAMAQWGSIFIEASKKIGNTFTVIADNIQRPALEQAGFTDIEQWDSKVRSYATFIRNILTLFFHKVTLESVPQRS